MAEDRWIRIVIVTEPGTPPSAKCILPTPTSMGCSPDHSWATPLRTPRLAFAASVPTCADYEFVRVRSRRASVTACPYPSLLK
jgi:hypothetical protein